MTLSIQARELSQNLQKETDQIFLKILAFQWPLIIILSFFNSPYTYEGSVRTIHPFIIVSFLIGGALTIFPSVLIHQRPGSKGNMYIVAICQMCYSILLIHLTHGRLESHFHIFGSLAFLASYNHKRLLVMAALIILIDHLVRGYFFPQFVYGDIDATLWRGVEHGMWVCFENFFLFKLIDRSNGRLQELSESHDHVTRTLVEAQEEIRTRTRELEKSQQAFLEQQKCLVQTSRLSALGFMSAGVAHEINNPLTIITATTAYLRVVSEESGASKSLIDEGLSRIEKTVERICRIIHGLKNVSRNSDDESPRETNLKELLDDVLSVCDQRFRQKSIELTIRDQRIDREGDVRIPRVQISQVLLNLLSNAYDAIEELSEKWIDVEISEDHEFFYVSITDSGGGIPEEIARRMFEPFFTTKPVGVGTGLGLAISISTLRKIGGDLFIDSTCVNTRFVLKIPCFEEASCSSAS